MSPCGISEPFIMASGNAVDKSVFRDNCKKLHLLAESGSFLCETLIHHVDKVDNPASLPEVRPIKDFWSILRAKAYENNREAKTLHELEVRIKKCLKEVDQVKILKTFGCVKKKTLRHSHV